VRPEFDRVRQPREARIGSKASRAGRAALGERPLTIFPEGTTNDGTALLPFKSSLLSAVEPLAHAVPVQPVALDYGEAAEIAWHGAESGMTNVRRILARRRPVELTIRFLEPLEGEALANRKVMATAAQDAISWPCNFNSTGKSRKRPTPCDSHAPRRPSGSKASAAR
jgi:1-acyl-sn-glycerol-3-phosphate acyltransferase